jgi:hypothetical protein
MALKTVNNRILLRSPPKNGGGNLGGSEIWRIRPNNYVLSIPILSNDVSVHLPILKNSGWRGTTKREYLDLPGVKVERTTKNVIFRLRKRFVMVVHNAQEIDKADQEVKDFLIDAAQRFQEQFPTIVLDLMKGKIRQKEIEIKDPKLRIPKDMIMRDTIGKKVYKKDDSIELYNPDLLKRYIRNRALEDWAPELETKMDILIQGMAIFGHQLEIHLNVLKGIGAGINEFGSKVTLLTDILIGFKTQQGENWLQTLGNFIKKIRNVHKKEVEKC